jgi:hypothetical protein
LNNKIFNKDIIISFGIYTKFETFFERIFNGGRDLKEMNQVLSTMVHKCAEGHQNKCH